MVLGGGRKPPSSCVRQCTPCIFIKPYLWNHFVSECLTAHCRLNWNIKSIIITVIRRESSGRVSRGRAYGMESLRGYWERWTPPDLQLITTHTTPRDDNTLDCFGYLFDMATTAGLAYFHFTSSVCTRILSHGGLHIQASTNRSGVAYIVPTLYQFMTD